MTTPVQRARMRAAALAIATGSHVIHLTCSHCGASFLIPSPEERDVLLCQACGRRTPLDVAHDNRRKRIKEFIEVGVDVDLLGGGRS